MGFEQALRGEFELAHLDYADPALEQAFAEHAGKSADELERELDARRVRPVAKAPVEGARRRARQAAWRADAEIRSVLVLLPHLGMYGGVNRFFELARCFGEQGVECVIATPDGAPHGGGKRLPRERPDYPGVRTVSFSEALGRSWDAVLCGDCTSGAMLTLPLFEARVSAVYLLNGWMRREANVRQMRLVEPDVVIANSSYCARYYADLAPIVIPGGVDLETFQPTAAAAAVSSNGDGPHAETGPLRVAAYAGRRKPIKRFDDVVAACTALHETGVGVELHVYDEREVELDVSVHAALARPVGAAGGACAAERGRRLRLGGGRCGLVEPDRGGDGLRGRGGLHRGRDHRLRDRRRDGARGADGRADGHRRRDRPPGGRRRAAAGACGRRQRAHPSLRLAGGHAPAR